MMHYPISPGHPVAPPLKKQRAGSTPAKPSDSRVEDAIAERRAKILELQQRKEQQDLVIDKARSHLLPSGPPPMSRNSTPSSAPLRSGGRPPYSAAQHGPPPMQGPPMQGPPMQGPPMPGPPRGSAIARVRHSDIFPSVPKVTTEMPNPESARPPLFSKAPPRPEVLARRLDASFSTKTSTTSSTYTEVTADTSTLPPTTRSRSAPPSRPRPPPRRPSPAEAPPENTSKSVSFTLPPRDFLGRPPPMTLDPSTPSSIPTVTFSLNNDNDDDMTPEQTATAGSAKNLKTPPEQTVGSVNSQEAGRTPFPTTMPPETPETPSPGEEDGYEVGKAGSLYTYAAGRTPFQSTTTMAQRTPEEEAQKQGLTKRNAGHTPFHSYKLDSSEISPDPMPTPPLSTSSLQMSPELRMQKEMTRLEKDKTDALNQIAKLQGEVQMLKQAEASSASITLTNAKDFVNVILHMAKEQGESAAIEWARHQIDNSSTTADTSNKTVGFLMPASSPSPGGPPMVGFSQSPSLTPMAARSSSHHGSGKKKRVPTPHPRRSKPTKKLSASEERTVLIKAAENTEHEYYCPIATFTVRRPFGQATERELWFSAGQLNSKMYDKTADPFKPATLEVVAQIEADGTLLALHGEAMVRHQSADGSWNEYGNADETLLGFVSYIDSDANEKDYSLDEIFLGARAVREHYCSSFSSVISAVRETLLQPGPDMQNAASAPPALSSAGAPAKSPTRDAGVGTEDIPFAAGKAEKKQGGGDSKAEEPEKKETKKKRKADPPEEPPAGVMGTFIGIFVNFVFNWIWTVFVGIPLRIVSTTIVMLFSAVIVATIWIYVADKNHFGSLEMGAPMHRIYSNPPGIA